MRRLTFFVIFLVGIVGSMEWLSRGYASTWEPQLRAYLETTASQLTKTQVHIDTITLGYFHRVRLLNVRVSEPDDPAHPIFQAAQIELTISLIDLPRAIVHRHPYDAIGLISIENPWVRLSKDTLARHKRPADAPHKPLDIPPWFTLAWEGGTFQWADAQAPHKAWTLYQSHGDFHIRGPQMNVSVSGSIDGAQSCRMQLASLGQHWTARALLTGGQSQRVLTLLQNLTHRAFLPKTLSVRGGFEFEARASGRRWPQRGDNWMPYLDRATLTFSHLPGERKPEGPALGLTGELVYRKGAITVSPLAFETPWLEGRGRATIDLGSVPGQSPLLLNATLASGKIGRWPFDNASLQMRYDKGVWQFEQNSFHFLNGVISAKGTITNAETNLAITAQEVSLSALGHERGIEIPEGRLNASCTLTGPLDDWQVQGAWWLTGVRWNGNSWGDARGDFQISPDQFQAQAKSDRTPFRVALNGSQSEKTFELEQLDITLPSGATFSGQARLTRPRGQLQGTFEAEHIALPADIPVAALNTYEITGTLGAQGRIGGTLEEPSAKVTLKSDDLSIKGRPVGAAAVTLVWDKSHYEIPTFHLGSGIEGQFSDGQGSIKISDAQVGPYALTRGTAHFNLTHGVLDLKDFSLQTKDAGASGQAKASWETKDARTQLAVEGKGHAYGVRNTDKWDVPFTLAGHIQSENGVKDGTLHVTAHVLDGMFKGDYAWSGSADHPEGQLTARLENAHWRAFPFSSDVHAVWSAVGLKPLSLKGHFLTGGAFEFNGLLSPDTQASGTLKLENVALRPLGESLHFPKPLQGVASATLTLKGPLAHLKWEGHLDGGPVTYAPESEHPFTLAKLAMDVTLAPLESDPSITHLMLNEGEVSTAEELIRFQPGSFVEFAGDKPARLALGMQIRNLHLGIFTLFGGLDLDGTWQIKPEGFAILGRAQTHSLFINDYELEEGQLLADYFNGVLKFTQPPNAPPLVTGTLDFHQAPQLKFTNFFISGKDQQGLQLTGQIGPSLWDFQMAGRGLDMGTLGELSGFPYPMSGAANVQIHGTGDPDHPHVEGKVDLTNGAILGLSYRTGSAAFVWQNERITFTKLLLTDPGRYTLDGAGMFPLIPKAVRETSSTNNSHTIDFSVRLRDSNLGLLQSLSNEVKEAKGAVDGLIQIKGTLENPDLHGSLRVTDGQVTNAHYFQQLKNANLDLEFNGNVVTIKEFRGKSGQGEFQGSGTIALAGFVPAQYDVRLDVTSPKGVEVQVPELAIPESPLAKRFKFLTSASRADVRGHVALRGPAEAPTFSGEGIISNGHFTFPPSHKHPPPPALLEWFRRITWDVNLKFQDNAWFENEFVQANVVGNLALKGPSDRLQVNGGLEMAEGKISYLGLQFDIQQAHYDIRSQVNGDSVVNTPFVRGVAQSQIQTVDTVSGVAGSGSRLSVNDTITLTIDYAPVDEIKPRLSSAANPTLTQDKLLARVTGTDVDNLTPQERNSLYQKQLVSMIDSSLTTPLAQNVLKKTGLADRVRVESVYDPNAATAPELNNGVVQQQSTAASLFANTKYTIEKDLNSRLSLGYGVRFVPSAGVVDPDLQTQQQKLDLISDVQLSYRWFRNVYLRGDFDLPTSDPNVLPERKVTIEPRWRFGWWGNTNKDKTDKPTQ